MPSIGGKVAVVTGSSKGIGFAIAEALIRAGANVTVSARSDREVHEAAARLDALGGGRALDVACDVRRPEAVRELIARTVAELGGLDILVNNAGVGAFGPVAELALEQWDQVIGTNLSGVFYCCREAIPHLRRRGGGWIINIGSLAGKNPLAGGAAYNASKFGLVGFSEALMLEVRYDDIRVTCLMPGSVASWSYAAWAAAVSRESQPGSPQVTGRRVPLGAMTARTGSDSSRHQVTSVRSPNVQIIAMPVPFAGSASGCARTGTGTSKSGVITSVSNSGSYRSSSGWATSATHAGSSSDRVVSISTNTPGAPARANRSRQ